MTRILTDFLFFALSAPIRPIRVIRVQKAAKEKTRNMKSVTFFIFGVVSQTKVCTPLVRNFCGFQLGHEQMNDQQRDQVS